VGRMESDLDKVDEKTCTLLADQFDNADGVGARKGHDWEMMDRLYSKGYLSDPKSNAKSCRERRGRETFKGNGREALLAETVGLAQT